MKSLKEQIAEQIETQRAASIKKNDEIVNGIRDHFSCCIDLPDLTGHLMRLLFNVKMQHLEMLSKMQIPPADLAEEMDNVQEIFMIISGCIFLAAENVSPHSFLDQLMAQIRRGNEMAKDFINKKAKEGVSLTEIIEGVVDTVLFEQKGMKESDPHDLN